MRVCPLSYFSTCIWGGSRDPCALGVAGPYCSLCEAEYYPTSDGCKLCADGEYIPTVIVVTLCLFIMVGVTYCCCFCSCCKQQEQEGQPAQAYAAGAQEQPLARQDPGEAAAQQRKKVEHYTSREKMLRSYATMMYSFFQIVASFEAVYRIAWLPSFASFVSVVGGVVFLNPFSMYPSSCVSRTDLHTKLAFYLCGYAAVHLGALAQIARLSQQEGQVAVARKETWMRGLIYFSNFFCEWMRRACPRRDDAC